MNQILISHYSPWSPTEIKELKSLAAAQMPVGAIANNSGVRRQPYAPRPGWNASPSSTITASSHPA